MTAPRRAAQRPSRRQVAPSHETVDQAVARLEPALRGCYREAATRAGEPPAGQLHVTLTVDEIGLARDVETGAARLPGFLDCLRDRSGRLRHGDPPDDVGAVRVSFTVDVPAE